MNENGYPVQRGGTLTENEAVRPNGMGTQDGASIGMRNGDGASSGCGSGDCTKNCMLAYPYVPDQKFRLLYSAPDALSHGTLFEELYKPMEVYGNE